MDPIFRIRRSDSGSIANHDWLCGIGRKYYGHGFDIIWDSILLAISAFLVYWVLRL